MRRIVVAKYLRREEYLKYLEKERIRREERDEEERLTQEAYAKIYKDSYKEEYPSKDFDMDSIYRDQAMVNTRGMGYNFFSAYLPYGIKKMDSWYSRQILAGFPKNTPEHLEEMIRKNPHLHNIIKTNLIGNIHSKLKTESI